MPKLISKKTRHETSTLCWILVTYISQSNRLFCTFAVHNDSCTARNGIDIIFKLHFTCNSKLFEKKNKICNISFSIPDAGICWSEQWKCSQKLNRYSGENSWGQQLGLIIQRQWLASSFSNRGSRFSSSMLLENLQMNTLPCNCKKMKLLVRHQKIVNRNGSDFRRFRWEQERDGGRFFKQL